MSDASEQYRRVTAALRRYYDDEAAERDQDVHFQSLILRRP